MSERPEQIERLTESAFDAFALLAGADLSIFTALSGRSASAEELASDLGIDASKLGPLLHALVVADLLDQADGRFSNRPEAERYLVRSSPDFIGDRHLIWADLWQAALQTADTVRTGIPQAEHDFTRMTPEEQSAYFRGLHPRALQSGRNFARSVDLSAYRSLLDVGCGSGGFVCGIAEANSQIDISATDLPAVLPIAHRFIAEAGHEDRIQLCATNVLNGPVTGSYDAVVLKNFLQVFSEGDARKILTHVQDAIAPRGHLYMLGDILENDRSAPTDSVRINLGLINLYCGGQAYTIGEYETWLVEAGYAEVTRLDEETIRARPAV